MLLKRCYVQGFGKLREFSYEFSQGLNVICTENGWGKSTFAAFLRAMFYGLPQAGARTKLDEAERRKYRPWNGGVMGGSLVFEVNGKEYKAERTFGKKEAEDTFRLIDLSTNLDSPDFSEELGKELFGLDKEAYSRSTYLPQNKISDGGMNDSIGKKLGRMAEGEDESGNFDKAFEMLEELRKKYIPDRQKDEKGYVAELTRKLSGVEADLDACRRKEESARPWREKEQAATEERKEAEAQLLTCRERLEAAAAYEALAAKKQHYSELCGQEESLRIKKESMEGLFRAGVPESAELQKCRRDAEEASVLAGELRSCSLDAGESEELVCLQRKFCQGVPDREEIQECICRENERKESLRRAEQLLHREEQTVQQAKKKKKLCFVPGVTFLLLAATCVFLAFGISGGKTKQTENVRQEEFQEDKQGANPVLLGLGGAFVLVTAVLFVTGIRTGKEERSAKERYEECLAETERLRKPGGKDREFLAQYGGFNETDLTGDLYRLAEEAGRYEFLSERREKQECCATQRETLLSSCNALLTKYGMDASDVAGGLHILETRTRDFVRISEDFAEAVKKREQFELETSPASFYGLVAPEISFAELQRTEQELLVRIARTTEEEKDCRDRAEAFEEEAEACAELEELREELQGRLERKKREHYFVTETIKCLKNAKERFSSRYLAGLTAGFEKYVSLLGDEDFSKSMNGQFHGVHTDINLTMQITAYGEEKELGYLSTGLKDLLGLCMRFALVDALFEEEPPFLVLDDPFVNLDKEKVARATAFLKEASKQYQILYLVCHESRV